MGSNPNGRGEWGEFSLSAGQPRGAFPVTELAAATRVGNARSQVDKGRNPESSPQGSGLRLIPGLPIVARGSPSRESEVATCMKRSIRLAIAVAILIAGIALFALLAGLKNTPLPANP